MRAIFNRFKAKKPPAISLSGQPVTCPNGISALETAGLILKHGERATGQDSAHPAENLMPEAADEANETVLLELGDFLSSLPESLLRAGELDPRLPIAVELQVLTRCLAEGRATALASDIFRDHAEIFRDGEMKQPSLEVRFPWRKIQQMLNAPGGEGLGARFVAGYKDLNRKRMAEATDGEVVTAPGPGGPSAQPIMPPVRGLNGRMPQEGAASWFTVQGRKAALAEAKPDASAPAPAARVAPRDPEKRDGTESRGAQATTQRSMPAGQPDFTQVPDLMMPAPGDSAGVSDLTSDAAGQDRRLGRGPAIEPLRLAEMPDLTEWVETPAPKLQSPSTPQAREPARLTAVPDFADVPDLMLPSASENNAATDQKRRDPAAQGQPARSAGAPPALAFDLAEMPDLTDLAETPPPAPGRSSLPQSRELARLTAERDAAVAQIARHSEATARERESMVREQGVLISALVARHEGTIAALRKEGETQSLAAPAQEEPASLGGVEPSPQETDPTALRAVTATWEKERAALVATMEAADANRLAERTQAAALQESSSAEYAALEKRSEGEKRDLLKKHEDSLAALAEQRQANESAVAEARAAEERHHLEIASLRADLLSQIAAAENAAEAKVVELHLAHEQALGTPPAGFVPDDKFREMVEHHARELAQLEERLSAETTQRRLEREAALEEKQLAMQRSEAAAREAETSRQAAVEKACGDHEETIRSLQAAAAEAANRAAEGHAEQVRRLAEGIEQANEKLAQLEGARQAERLQFQSKFESLKGAQEQHAGDAYDQTRRLSAQLQSTLAEQAKITREHDGQVRELKSLHAQTVASMQTEHERALAEAAANHQQAVTLREAALAAAGAREATARLEFEATIRTGEQTIAAQAAQLAELTAKLREATEKQMADERASGVDRGALEEERARALAELAAKEEQLEWKGRALAELEAEIDAYRKRITVVLRERDALSRQNETLGKTVEVLKEAGENKLHDAAKLKAEARQAEELRQRLEEAVNANRTLISTLLSCATRVAHGGELPERPLADEPTLDGGAATESLPS